MIRWKAICRPARAEAGAAPARVPRVTSRALARLLLVFVLLAGALPPPARAAEVDLELVLAMDGSGSINAAEFRLQLFGTAAAFRQPDIQQAIRSGPHGRIAVALVIWSDAAFPKYPTPWFVLDSPRSADRFAAYIATFRKNSGRRYGIGGGGTGIGSGVVYALNMIAGNGHTGLRKVIDVSGDGTETDPWFKKAVTMPGAKLLARRQNVTINGLAILTDFSFLQSWYRTNVIGGPGSFVIKAASFDDFAEAIHRKLLREISSAVSLAPAHAPAARNVSFVPSRHTATVIRPAPVKPASRQKPNGNFN